MQVSTKSAKKYWMSNHLQSASNGLLDPLSPVFTQLRNQVNSWTTLEYKGQPFTTLINTLYGNTSVWWLVLYYNGYISPLDIPHGAILRIPNRDQLSSFLGDNRSVFGTTVTL